MIATVDQRLLSGASFVVSAPHITVFTDRPFGMRSSSLTKLGRVTEEDGTISECVRIGCIVSPLDALKICGKCNPRGKTIAVIPEQLERVHPSLKVDRTENLPQMLKI